MPGPYSRIPGLSRTQRGLQIKKNWMLANQKSFFGELVVYKIMCRFFVDIYKLQVTKKLSILRICVIYSCA